MIAYLSSITFLFLSAAAIPLPAPQGSSFTGLGGIVGLRAGTQSWNSAAGSANAQQAAISQVQQSQWGFANPNAAFGGNAGTWNNDQPPPSIPQQYNFF